MLLGHVTGLPFGVVFFLVNLPLYWRRMGAAFAVRTFASVAALSTPSALMPHWAAFEGLDALFGAVLVGL